jgi:hypothetical protein
MYPYHNRLRTEGYLLENVQDPKHFRMILFSKELPHILINKLEMLYLQFLAGILLEQLIVF